MEMGKAVDSIEAFDDLHVVLGEHAESTAYFEHDCENHAQIAHSMDTHCLVLLPINAPTEEFASTFPPSTMRVARESFLPTP